MDYLSFRLRSLRKQLHLTQEQLAKRAKTTTANISGYESGNIVPSLGTILRLCQALNNCSIDYLVGRTNTLGIYHQDNHQQLPINEFIDKYTIILRNGSLLSREEIEEMLDYIQIRREMGKWFS